MEIQQLRYVIAISQEKHFLRAAQRVNVTQPTLSQQVKKLEDELGTPLFERSPQGVKLTAAGEQFLPYAVAALDQLKQGVATLKEETGALTGTISLGAIPTIGPYLLPQMLLQLKKEAPQLALELYEETTSSLLESLRIGKIDLGILALPIDVDGIATESIGQEPFYLAVATQHSLAKTKRATTKMIQAEKLLILQEGHCFGDQALEYCQRDRTDTQTIFQGSSLTSVMKLAAIGEGLTLVPQMAALPKENPNLVFIPFAKPQPYRELGIIWRITTPLTPAHRLCMALIRQTFEQLGQ